MNELPVNAISTKCIKFWIVWFNAVILQYLISVVKQSLNTEQILRGKTDIYDFNIPVPLSKRTYCPHANQMRYTTPLLWRSYRIQQKNAHSKRYNGDGAPTHVPRRLWVFCI